jgi:hypothetical protein
MALAERIPRLRAASEERSRFQRFRVNLSGRYMLADQREFPCQVVNMSPGGMALIAPVSGTPVNTSSRMWIASAGSKATSRARSKTASL